MTRVAITPDATRSVVSLEVLVLTIDGSPLAALVRGPNPQFGRPLCTVELLAVDAATGDAFMAELKAELEADTVLRGQIISLQNDPFAFHGAESALRLLPRPTVTADQIVLHDGVLERVRRHVIGIQQHKDALLAAGQHLGRGVLLYGPPGTGKTHLVRHLLTEATGVTVILLSGNTLEHVGTATQLARAAQPSIIVLEDCDLVAEHRGGDTNAALFETLEAMDGLAGDADIAFVLTTNRPDLLERALVERPGRVDLAVEIPRPDAEHRLRLLRLYAPPGAEFGDALLTDIVERTEGATASFAKELMRRTVLIAAEAGRAVTDDDLQAACTEMLSDSETFTRTLLGLADDPGWVDDDDHGDASSHPGYTSALHVDFDEP